MKQASSALIEFLASKDSETMKIADLYTITLKNGTVIRYTSADFNIKISGSEYLADNACIQRGEISQETGLSVDDLQIEFNPGINDTVCGIKMIKAFIDGYFDGADFRLDLAIFKNGWSGAPLILEKLFVGTLDVEEISGSYVKGSVKSPVEKLSCDFPTNCYQSSCHHTLYGECCGLNKNTYTEAEKTISANSTKTKIYCTLTKPAGYYTNGMIEFLDGQNAGLIRAVKVHEDGVLTLALPLLFTPVTGETFSICAGCDKTIAMCKTKFNNFANFGGTPFIPEGDSTI